MQIHAKQMYISLPRLGAYKPSAISVDGRMIQLGEAELDDYIIVYFEEIDDSSSNSEPHPEAS